jgi:hypothetical protein
MCNYFGNLFEEEDDYEMEYDPADDMAGEQHEQGVWDSGTEDGDYWQAVGLDSFFQELLLLLLPVVIC